ncbi:MAG: helix-turn-helix transcriptional regulator [Chloroflexi bacterium]|nr:helix-turn-helix transcriptional regulator [Chloroflexota bacterium]
MRPATPRRATAFGRHLQQWRRQRGLSQLELALRADVSQRHISFLETGRARPREAVVHKVAEALAIPLRERNMLLAAAGLAPGYPEVPLSDGAVAPFRHAIQRMLAAHEPYPAYVVNRWWEVVDANAAGRRLFPQAGAGPITAVNAFLGPGPLRESIDNFPEVAWTFLRRLRSEVASAGPDERLRALLERAETYMQGVPPGDAGDADLGAELAVCPRLKIGDQVIRTVSMVARFGGAREVTLDELRVELVFPGDAEAEAFFRRSAQVAHDALG